MWLLPVITERSQFLGLCTGSLKLRFAASKATSLFNSLNIQLQAANYWLQSEDYHELVVLNLQFHSKVLIK